MADLTKLSDEELEKRKNFVAFPNMWIGYNPKTGFRPNFGKNLKPIFDEHGLCWWDYREELMRRQEIRLIAQERKKSKERLARLGIHSDEEFERYLQNMEWVLSDEYDDL